jgi:hypothetical protein
MGTCTESQLRQSVKGREDCLEPVRVAGAEDVVARWVDSNPIRSLEVSAKHGRELSSESDRGFGTRERCLVAEDCVRSLIGKEQRAMILCSLELGLQRRDLRFGAGAWV